MSTAAASPAAGAHTAGSSNNTAATHNSPQLQQQRHTASNTTSSTGSSGQAIATGSVAAAAAAGTPATPPRSSSSSSSNTNQGVSGSAHAATVANAGAEPPHSPPSVFKTPPHSGTRSGGSPSRRPTPLSVGTPGSVPPPAAVARQFSLPALPESMTPLAHALYLLNALAKEGLLSPKAKSLLKALIMRQDARLLDIANSLREESTNVTDVAEVFNNLAIEEAFHRFQWALENFEAAHGLLLHKAQTQLAPDGTAQSVAGPIDFLEFAKLLSGLTTKSGQFVHLGSGLGDALLAASLLCDFTQIHGVESNSEVIRASQALRRTFRVAEAALRELVEDAVPIHLHEATIRDYDWSFADVVMITAQRLVPDEHDHVIARLADLRPGAIVVFIGQPCASRLLDLVAQIAAESVQGPSQFYVYSRRRRDDIRIAAPDYENDLSSPQGTALMAAKRNRGKAMSGAQVRSIAFEDVEPPSSPHDTSLMSAKHHRSKRMSHFNPAVAMEAAGLQPSSPHGNALLAAKARFQHRPVVDAEDED